MKKIIFFSNLLILIFVLINFSFSQPYLPQNIGNKFIYYYSYWSHYTGGGGSSGSYRMSAKITKDTVINNRHYFFYDKYPAYNNNNKWIRLDSLTNSIYEYDANNNCSFYYHEALIDSLNITTGNYNSCYTYRHFSGNDTMTLFGQFGQIKKFYWNYITSYNCYYHYQFGIVLFKEDYEAGSNGYHGQGTLIGCVINGITYGDTTLTFVNQISKDIPKEFILSQNYPNPFNPTTKIKFEIPLDVKRERSNVKLIIYDILGKEISTLVNESLQPGTYEVTFDGSNLSTGIYFYVLKAGDYIETKKMVLIK
jgi:hypothetical protein